VTKFRAQREELSLAARAVKPSSTQSLEDPHESLPAQVLPQTVQCWALTHCR
jgi:hypothetical protein